MALLKTIMTPSGVEATVWDITKVEWLKSNGETITVVHGWSDADAMSSGKDSLDNRRLVFYFEVFPYLSQVYDKVKESRLDADGNETNEFAGATRT
jgi:hypothetical protein